LHGQRYYVFPRDVQEFMIWEGTVYRLTGIGRHTRRRIPAWLISLLFPYIGLLRNVKAKVREWAASAVSVGAAMAVEHGSRIVRSIAWAGRIGRSSAKAISLRAIVAMRRIDRAMPQLRPFLRPAVRLAYKIRYHLLYKKPQRTAARPHARGKFRLWVNRRLRPMMKRQRDRFIQTAKALTCTAKALTYNVKRMIFKISWSRYAVQGVVTADRRETALAMIAKTSNAPLAGDGAEPRVVRRARLARMSALGPGPEPVVNRPSTMA